MVRKKSAAPQVEHVQLVIEKLRKIVVLENVGKVLQVVGHMMMEEEVQFDH